jgi:chorismate mutase
MFLNVQACARSVTPKPAASLALLVLQSQRGPLPADAARCRRQFPTSQTRVCRLRMASPVKKLNLEDLRTKLIRQEETIIFALIERAQFKHNAVIYEKNGPLFRIPGFTGSFLDYLLVETERLHAKVRRYTAPDEHAFFPNQLPQPILPPLDYEQVLHPNDINVNHKIMQVYVHEIVNRLTEEGDDLNYGSSCVNDVACLQALSKRIHYGKFVAEAKYQANKEQYQPLIERRDAAAIEQLLTDRAVEEKLLRRIEMKAATYGREVEVGQLQRWRTGSDRFGDEVQQFPHLLANIYEHYVIPLTKEVEVLYMLQRWP